jgi:hypothetical protein
MKLTVLSPCKRGRWGAGPRLSFWVLFLVWLWAGDEKELSLLTAGTSGDSVHHVLVLWSWGAAGGEELEERTLEHAGIELMLYGVNVSLAMRLLLSRRIWAVETAQELAERQTRRRFLLLSTYLRQQKVKSLAVWLSMSCLGFTTSWMRDAKMRLADLSSVLPCERPLVVEEKKNISRINFSENFSACKVCKYFLIGHGLVKDFDCVKISYLFIGLLERSLAFVFYTLFKRSYWKLIFFSNKSTMN